MIKINNTDHTYTLTPEEEFKLSLIARRSKTHNLTLVLKNAIELIIRDEFVDRRSVIGEPSVFSKTWSNHEAIRLVKMAQNAYNLLDYHERMMWYRIHQLDVYNNGKVDYDALIDVYDSLKATQAEYESTINTSVVSEGW